MINSTKEIKVLFIGESWSIHMIHTKGYDSFTSTKYEEGATFLLKCLRDKGVVIDYIPAHLVQTSFPSEQEVLSKYDVIVISDIGSNTFLLQNDTFYNMKIKKNALSLIEEYVSSGGGLLMIGGYLSFMGIEAKANYKNTILEKVLPVEMFDRDDRVEMPEGISMTPNMLTHSSIEGFKEWPVFLGYNQVVAKLNTEIVLMVGDDPLLVYGSYRKGKTACFMSDCSPHWGSHQFMAWPYYTQMWLNILKYISRS